MEVERIGGWLYVVYKVYRLRKEGETSVEKMDAGKWVLVGVGG
jgi:hypothetical protein